MKKRSPIHAYKRLLARGQDWDYAFHLYHLIREYKLMTWWD